MIRIPEIVTALMPLVGWRQAYNPSEAIDRTLLQSESGLYYQDAHPLMTLTNIMAAMPHNFFFQYPEWNMITEFRKGTKVRHGGIVWVALQDNIGKEPPASDFNDDFSNDFGGDYWLAYNFVSDYLTQQTQAGITQTIQTFLQIKGLLRETKDLLERRTFFDGAGRMTNLFSSRSFRASKDLKTWLPVVITSTPNESSVSALVRSIPPVSEEFSPLAITISILCSFLKRQRFFAM